MGSEIPVGSEIPAGSSVIVSNGDEVKPQKWKKVKNNRFKFESAIVTIQQKYNYIFRLFQLANYNKF